MSKKKFNYNYLTILIALSLNSYADNNINVDSPFARIPLHLQSESSVVSSLVKPNVLLQFDNSGSMGTADAATLYGGKTTRINAAREALKKVLNNDKYKNAYNWAFITLNEQNDRGIDKSNTIVGRYIRALQSGSPNWQFAMNVHDINNYLNILQPQGATPSSSRYLDSLYILRRAMKYRCQLSFIILFSDGEPNESYIYYNDKYSFKNMYKHPGLPSSWLQYYTFSTRTLYEYNLEPQYLHYFYGKDVGPNPNVTKFVPATTLSAHKYHLFNENGQPNEARPWPLYDDFLRYYAEAARTMDLQPVGVDAAGKSWNDPLFFNGKQTIGTYSIGFGRDVKNSKYLNGGSVSNNYKAYVVNSEDELYKAFEDIFAKISSTVEENTAPPTSFSSLAPAVSSDDSTIKIPNMAAAVRLFLNNAASEIRFYDLTRVGNNNGSTVNSNAWTTPSFDNRKTLINDGKDIQWADNFSGSNANNSFFGINNNINANEWKTALLPWLTRSVSDENIANQANLSMKYRKRTGKDESNSPQDNGPRDMGDVIDSGILAYGPIEYGRQKYLVTAANDGMVYLFKSQNNKTHPYDLKLNYIPAGMERQSADDTVAKHFKNIANINYIRLREKPVNGSHIEPIQHEFLLNGGFVIRTMDKSGPEQIFMAGNMGQGGRGSYALNIGGQNRNDSTKQVGLDAPVNDWKTSVPLFETPKTGNGYINKMGYTIGSPQIGRVSLTRSLGANGAMTTNLHDVRYSVFVGSGVHNPTDYTNKGDNTESALYVYNAISNLNVGQSATPNGTPNPENKMKAGELIKKITVPTNLGKGGLAQPTLVDSNFDGVIDIVYAGDYSGGVYRFDLRTGNADTWKVTKIFQTKNNQPITSAPGVFRTDANKFIVIFGTGSDIYQSDLTNTSVQSVYGIYDDLTQNQPVQVQQNELIQQTVNNGNYSINGVNYAVRTISDNPLNTNKGWFFDLPESGERVVVKPDLLLKTVLLITKSYKSESKHISPENNKDQCLVESNSVKSSGESWIMQVKADNGGNLPISNLNNSSENDAYAYADFLRQSKDRNRRTITQIFAGIKSIGGGLTNMAIISGGADSNVIGNYGNAVTRNGDSGGSGKDPQLTSNPIEPKQCFSDNDNYIYQSDSSGNSNGKKVTASISLEDGVSDAIDILGKKCENGKVRRLSWREIF